jgi:cobyrinic acid a,c-diamide synthase
MSSIPRVIISGLSGGAGKTMLSLGLARHYSRQGFAVRAFKKGPDYIDAAWLSLAARSPQANLDPFFTPGEALRALFQQGSRGYDLAVVEGNRGLFDGLDISGSCSTAEVSRVLRAPVLLVLDCTKMTRTAAALVKGCLRFEEGLRIGGVVLNRTGNERHQTMVRRAVEELAEVPVLGVLPRRQPPFIFERHMGLAGMDELERTDALLDSLADFVGEHVDTAAVLRLAEDSEEVDSDSVWGSAPRPARGIHQIELARAVARDERPLDPHIVLSANSHGDYNTRGAKPDPHDTNHNAGSMGLSPLAGVQGAAPHGGRANITAIQGAAPPGAAQPRIGYAHDAAFWFYYQENLDALREAGATLVPLSLLDAAPWPTIDGLYLGGGLPELHASRLAANTRIREHVAALSRAGLPIYAECGGFMYLAKALELDSGTHLMAGVFPWTVKFCPRPQGLGYVEAESVAPNPYHPQGLRFRGHEFHFSGLQADGDDSPLAAERFLLRLGKGRGMWVDAQGVGYDGLLVNRTFASYTHIFAPAVPDWAENFVRLCINCNQSAYRAGCRR